MTGNGIFFSFAGSQGGPAQLVIVADDFDDLNAQYPTGPDGVGVLAYVSNPQGTAWLPGGLGGDYYGKGLYEWNGSAWVEANNLIEEELANILTALTGKRDTTAQKNSIEDDLGDLQLVGDVLSPGNDQYYGTDNTGTKGWYALPVGGGGSFSVDLDSADPNVSRVFAVGVTTFTITHNLGTLDINPYTREISSGDGVYPDYNNTVINTLDVSFSGNVADGLYRTTITT